MYIGKYHVFNWDFWSTLQNLYTKKNNLLHKNKSDKHCVGIYLDIGYIVHVIKDVVWWKCLASFLYFHEGFSLVIHNAQGAKQSSFKHPSYTKHECSVRELGGGRFYYHTRSCSVKRPNLRMYLIIWSLFQIMRAVMAHYSSLRQCSYCKRNRSNLQTRNTKTTTTRSTTLKVASLEGSK